MICAVFLLISSFVAFSANVIQFGLDQLHDAPTDDSVLYIHWYIWTLYTGTTVIFNPLTDFVDTTLIAFFSLFLLASSVWSWSKPLYPTLQTSLVLID